MSTPYRGMAHFPKDDGVDLCWQCSHFLPARHQKGRCIKFLEFINQSYRVHERDPDGLWWRGWPTISRLSLGCKYFVAPTWTTYQPTETTENNMKRPTKRAAAWLKRIAISPLMITKTPEEKYYSLQDGTPVPPAIAHYLINCGWLKAERDGLFEEPQTYRALTP